jgi:hypothetical protein
MDYFPDEPEVPAEQRAEASSALRYEDVSQDGRLMLLGLPHVLGDTVWQKLLVHHPLTRASYAAGIVPILSRFVLEGGDGPLSVSRPLTTSACYRAAHTVDEVGEPNRLLLEMWASAQAPRARTNGAAPVGEGEPIFAGRVYAEHVFTRLFAPPAERKVLRFDVEGVEPVPPTRRTWRPPEAVLDPPPDARWLDEELRADDAEVVFGLHHTDSNQHVNSLVYPRLFQDAALRRFAAHGVPARVLPRHLEIAYRKPCFAGDRARVLLRAFRDGPRVGAVGAFVPEPPGDNRPHCTLQMTFTE